uniref:Pleckstrin homology domain containing, family M (with RUN domain) member 1 n=1 Tax=Cyprinus carpio TaxID=7962 RepID=A0A8C2B230_CYPCA
MWSADLDVTMAPVTCSHGSDFCSPQWIKDKIARTLKVLQKRYITTDTAVTSEDLEANLLCCALEAVFIHGIKSKFIRSDGGHVRKGGSRGALPQPVFWSLLKTVTHRWDLKEDFDVFIPASDSATQAVNDNTHKPDASPAATQDTHLSDAHISEQSKACSENISAETLQETEESKTLVKPATVTETPEGEQRNSSVDSPSVSASTETAEKTSDLKDPDALPSETSTVSSSVEKSQHAAYRRSASTVSRKTSSDSLYSSCKSTSWISEDDFYKPEKMDSPEAYAVIDIAQMNGQESPTSEPAGIQSAPSVVHRRHNGLPNPFRGLLKLGQLERRSAVGMWWDYSCELSPFELRLYINAEERICYENLSLLRCEDVHLSSSTEGRFRLSFPGKRIYLRAPSRGEAEDWVDRIVEAISKLRPMMRDEQWDVLHTSHDQDVPSPTPSSPEHVISELPDTPQLDWTRHKDPEPDAIKEAVVYQNLEEKGWRSVLLSLSLETLRGYQVQGDSKTPLFIYPIGSIRDVVPDVSLGSPAFFKVLTVRDTLTLRAESGEECFSLCLCSLALSKSHCACVCAGCPRQIGMSLGRARLCAFSGQYYCESCHQGDTTIIPSRMLHNWDLTAREVSKQAFKLLTQIEHEPLLHLDVLNPDLFDHTDIMERVQSLRLRLRFLGDYILICRSGISKQIQPRLQQRTFLLDNSDLYSVLDLQQIADGHYESYLQSLIQFGSKHVHSCDLCTQRGFICQICNSDNIIFPFQFDSTIRCEVCKTVFHSSCKAKCPVCPRCVRIQKYMERDLED